MTARPRVALVCNRKSGAGRQPEEVAAALERHGAEVEMFDIDAIAEAAGSGAQRLVVAGGDGSIAPCAQAAGRAGMPLAVIPTGTANDFARALGLPDDLDDACRLAVTGTRHREVDLGLAGELPFVNVAGAGLAVRAAREASPLKRALGPLAYAVGALRAGVSAKPLAATVRVDGETLVDGPVWQLVVANSGAFGAGSGIAEADPSDGLLHVVAISAGPRLGLIRRAAGLRSGRIAEQPGVVHRAGREIEVDVAPETAFNVDGEVRRLGATRFTIHPHAFRCQV